jgi:hypothetical protein
MDYRDPLLAEPRSVNARRVVGLIVFAMNPLLTLGLCTWLGFLRRLPAFTVAGRDSLSAPCSGWQRSDSQQR